LDGERSGARAADGLRSRGVTTEDYDMPGLKPVDGIADFRFARMAWVADPGDNAIGDIEERA